MQRMMQAADDSPFLLSVLLPVCDEEETLEQLLSKLVECEFIDEIIAVDDGSADSSRQMLQKWVEGDEERRKLCIHETRQGKGSAIHTALKQAQGKYVIIQDADLEYDPRDILELLETMEAEQVDAVYGSRLLPNSNSNFVESGHRLANCLLTKLCNLASAGRCNLTDMATCYKLIRRNLFQSTDLKESGFGLEPELTLKLAQKNAVIHEVPISYQGRRFKDGKKIRRLDGFRYLRCIWQYRVRT